MWRDMTMHKFEGVWLCGGIPFINVEEYGTLTLTQGSNVGMRIISNMKRITGHLPHHTKEFLYIIEHLLILCKVSPSPY